MNAELGPCACIECVGETPPGPCGNAAAFFYHHVTGFLPWTGDNCYSYPPLTTWCGLSGGDAVLVLIDVDSVTELPFKLYHEYRIDKLAEGDFSYNSSNKYPGVHISIRKTWIYRINRYTGETETIGPTYNYAAGTPNDTALADLLIPDTVEDHYGFQSCLSSETVCDLSDDWKRIILTNHTYCYIPGTEYYEFTAAHTESSYALFDSDDWSTIRSRIDSLWNSVTTTQIQDHAEDFGELSAVAYYRSDGTIAVDWSTAPIEVNLPVRGTISHNGCTTYQSYQALTVDGMWMGVKALVRLSSSPLAFALNVGQAYTRETWSVPCLNAQSMSLDATSSYTPGSPGWYALEAPWQKMQQFV